MSEPEETPERPRRTARWTGIGIASALLVAAIAVPTVGMVFSNSSDAATTNAIVTPLPSESTTPPPQSSAPAQFQLGLPDAPASQAAAAPAVGTAGDPTAGLGITPTIVSQADVLKLVKKYFPADQVGNAMAVASCESGQQSIKGEVNSDGTTDWGIFQLNDGGTLQSSLTGIGVKYKDVQDAAHLAMNAETNVRAAAWIMYQRGWAPWTCAYKQQIVAALYSNTPGPMYGKFTAIGVATTSPEKVKKQLEDLKKAAKQRIKEAEKAQRQKAKEEAAKKAAEEAAKKAASKSPSPSPTPSASVSTNATASPTP